MPVTLRGHSVERAMWQAIKLRRTELVIYKQIQVTFRRRWLILRKLNLDCPATVPQGRYLEIKKLGPATSRTLAIP